MSIKEKIFGRRYEVRLSIEGGKVQSDRTQLLINGKPYQGGDDYMDRLHKRILENDKGLQLEMDATRGKFGESSKYHVSHTIGGIIPQLRKRPKLK